MASVRRRSNKPTRTLEHVHPDDVTLQAALDALADPVRRSIVGQLAATPEWTRACGTFELPVGKATSSHHFAVLRAAGLLEQRDDGARRLNRLRRQEFDRRFPGLLTLVLSDGASSPGAARGAGGATVPVSSSR
jgi:DNA-binding transcriptional ArsR family regulator